MGNVFDRFTERLLFKLMSQGHFDGLIGPLFMGKEANVFAAKKGDGKVIVKIYRLETCDFNKMYDYLKYDPRFHGLKKKKRLTIFAWTQREYRNLLKARQAGVRVPKPIAASYNVLVEEFIGHKEPALKLKDLPPKNKNKFYKQVIENMKKLHKAGLVHGDLSEFNILNHDDSPVLIDFSQASVKESHQFKELLERDCKNIARFFSKLGVKTDKEKIKKFFH